MVYVKHHTTIPVPTVYGYCKDEHNPVGCPFMILEVVRDLVFRTYTQRCTQLQSRWKVKGWSMAPVTGKAKV